MKENPIIVPVQLNQPSSDQRLYRYPFMLLQNKRC